MNSKKISVALIDDHVLLRNGLANLIGSFGDYSVLFEADNGKKCIEQLQLRSLPDIILMDINMPEMDGYDTAMWVKAKHPQIKLLALSMYDNDNAIIRMLKNGAKGYILKDIEPNELKAALDAVWRKGFYYSEMVTGKLIHSINTMDEPQQKMKTLVALNDREIEFLKLACTEKTYKEIADNMFVSPRTIDGYRDGLFEKLHVKTRVGLVIYAIKNGIVNV
jgi:two-component system invasion response regulator UvrY